MQVLAIMNTGNTKKRRIYDLTSKKLIIAYAEKHGNRAAGRFYNIPESCIRLWRKSLIETNYSQDSLTSKQAPLSALPSEALEPAVPATELPLTIESPPENLITTEQVNINRTEQQINTNGAEEINVNTAEASSNANNPTVIWYVQLDEELRKYVKQLYEEGSPVLLDEILLKTYDIVMSLNVSRKAFEMSREWVKTFLKYRSSIPYQISKSPSIVKGIEMKLWKYHNVVTQLRKQHRYSFNQIGNAHQVKIFLDFPPSNEKCVTVMLSVTADGNKLPPFVVFKSDNILNKSLPRNIIVRTGENGNMTSKLMTEWYRLVWGCRTGMEYNPRALLTLDYSISHLLAEDWLVEGNTDIIVIPKGMNIFPQPLNVHIHKVFKDNLRWECEKWLLSHGRLKSASASLIVYWIAGAWKNVPEDLIRNLFKTCHLSSDLVSLETAKYNIIENCVVFCEKISVSRTISSEVPNNNSSVPSQQNDSTVSKQAISKVPSSSSVAVQCTAVEQISEANTFEDVKKQTQDPLGVGAHEERSILNKLLTEVKMENHDEDQGCETSDTMDNIVNQQEVASSVQTISPLEPPKGHIMLMMHNGNVVRLEDALPSTLDQML